MARLSVIVPVYNAAATLDRCVDSILASAPEDCELFLIDDGSTDGGGSRCDARAAADPCVRAIHQPNLGVSAARNRGLREVTGEYVAFVDADDAIAPDYLSRARALMERMDADVVVGGVREIYRARAFVLAPRVAEPVALSAAARRALVRLTISNTPGAVDGLPGGIWADGLSGKLYRRAVLPAFRPGLFYGEDALYNIRVFLSARVVLAPEIWYNYVHAEGSLCHRFNGALFENTRVFFSELEKIIAAAPDPAEREALAGYARLRRINWLLMLVKGYVFDDGGALTRAEKGRYVRAFLADEGYREALRGADRGKLSAFKRLFAGQAARGRVLGTVALAAVSRARERARGYRLRGRPHAEE